VSDSDKDPLRDLLSEFALGPAWARAGGDKAERKPRTQFEGDARPPRREQQGRDFQGRDQGERKPRRPQGRGQYDDRRGPPQREDAPPPPGLRATIVPDAAAVHLIGKEVHQVARVYPLYDVAQILLAERSRCRVLFELEPGRPPLYRGKLDESLFLTREEAIRHLWNSPLKTELIDEETVEVDPPSGNFQSVARCGISGEWLGPPNFHSYQTQLRRLHRERFAHMPFEQYASKVRTERSEEAVAAWLESMKQRTRWRLKNQPEGEWIEDRTEAERAVAANCFDQAFAETRSAEVSAAIPGKHLSPPLLTSLRMAGSHARKHPAILIPAVCRALEAEHLPVFKRQGKLHTGPARPHPLAPDAVLAERPGIMVSWIRANKPAKLEGLWKAVLPEGSTAPPAEFAADLFWLLQQGHILLFTDDTLVVQEPREAQQPKQPKAPKPPREPKTPKQAPAATAEPDSAQTDAPAAEPTAETPDAPASSQATEPPSAQDSPEPPDAPVTPEPPSAPEPPPTPDTPEVPEAPEPPSAPEAPEPPSAPEAPATPEIPDEFPSAPEIPQEAPGQPDLPEAPQLPESPATPGIPPEMPGSPAPH
jgi:hypothetical protein